MDLERLKAQEQWDLCIKKAETCLSEHESSHDEWLFRAAECLAGKGQPCRAVERCDAFLRTQTGTRRPDLRGAAESLRLQEQGECRRSRCEEALTGLIEGGEWQRCVERARKCCEETGDIRWLAHSARCNSERTLHCAAADDYQTLVEATAERERSADLVGKQKNQDEKCRVWRSVEADLRAGSFGDCARRADKLWKESREAKWRGLEAICLAELAQHPDQRRAADSTFDSYLQNREPDREPAGLYSQVLIHREQMAGTEPVESSTDTLAWSLIGGGAAAAVLGVVGQLASQSERGQFEDARLDATHVALTSQEAADLESNAQRWWTASVVGTGLAVASLTAGLVLLLSDDYDATTVTTRVLPGGAALGASGHF